LRHPKKQNIRFDALGFVRCRVCGCTEIDPCDPPCGWAEEDLCTTCQDAIEAMATWFQDSRRPNLAGLLREYRRRVYDTPIPYRVPKRRAG
jgi:hypothetical protein